MAVHAPSGSNQQGYRFVFVDDQERKDALADLYRQSMEEFVGRARTDAPEDTVDRSSEADRRMTASVEYLRDHFHEVPVLCVPLMAGRTDGDGAGAHAERTAAVWQAMRWGSVLPTVWSFLLALRSRGLGSAWTTLSVVKEREVAEVLGIPYDRWTQVGLFPIAHTIGTDFAVTPRRPATDVLRWNSYGGDAPRRLPDELTGPGTEQVRRGRAPGASSTSTWASWATSAVTEAALAASRTSSAAARRACTRGSWSMTTTESTGHLRLRLASVLAWRTSPRPAPPSRTPAGRRRRRRRAARWRRATGAVCTEPSCHHDQTSSVTKGRNGANRRSSVDSASCEGGLGRRMPPRRPAPP